MCQTPYGDVVVDFESMNLQDNIDRYSILNNAHEALCEVVEAVGEQTGLNVMSTIVGDSCVVGILGGENESLYQLHLDFDADKSKIFPIMRYVNHG